MALNYPGPDEIRLTYTRGSNVHVMRLNCTIQTYPSPPFTFADLNVALSGGGYGQLDTEVDNWVALIDAGFNGATTTFNYAELYHYTPGTFDSSFQTIYDISAAATSGSSAVAAGQAIFVFRTREGGLFKLNLMESIAASGVSQSYSIMPTWAKDIVDDILGSTNPWIGRDTSFPASFLRWHPGINEALFKKLYRA